MRKLLTLLMVGIIAVTLSACSSGSSSADTVLVKSDSGKITKEELYKELKKSIAPQVLRNMVFKQWLKENYDVSKKVDQKIKKTKENFGGKEKFKKFLKKKGQTIEGYREALAFSLAMKQARTEGIKVSEDEMKAYYEENKKDKYTKIKASHILVKTKDKAQAIEKKLQNGANFAKLD